MAVSLINNWTISCLMAQHCMYWQNPNLCFIQKYVLKITSFKSVKILKRLYICIKICFYSSFVLISVTIIWYFIALNLCKITSDINFEKYFKFEKRINLKRKIAELNTFSMIPLHKQSIKTYHRSQNSTIYIMMPI